MRKRAARALVALSLLLGGVSIACESETEKKVDRLIDEESVDEKLDDLRDQIEDNN